MILKKRWPEARETGEIDELGDDGLYLTEAMVKAINLDKIRENNEYARRTSHKQEWEHETQLLFNLLYTTLDDYLRLTQGSGFCQVDREWEGPNFVCYHLSNKNLGRLGSIRLIHLLNYTEIQYQKEADRAGEMYVELLDGWLQALEIARQRIEANSQQSSVEGHADVNDFIEVSWGVTGTRDSYRIKASEVQDFIPAALGLSDKEHWAKIADVRPMPMDDQNTIGSEGTIIHPGGTVTYKGTPPNVTYTEKGDTFLTLPLPSAGNAQERARGGRGAYTNTPDKVRRFHNLRKKGVQQSEALKKVKSEFGKALDLRTYQDNCFRITGEDPIRAD